MNCSFLFLAALLFASAATAVVVDSDLDYAMRAEPSASPDAMPDPEMMLSLIVVPAANSAGPQKMLAASSSICPTDYTNGYSVMCRSPYARAAFYIDSNWVRTEKDKPFYAFGNKPLVGIEKFIAPAGKSMFTLACKSGGEVVRTMISLTC